MQPFMGGCSLAMRTHEFFMHSAPIYRHERKAFARPYLGLIPFITASFCFESVEPSVFNRFLIANEGEGACTRVFGMPESQSISPFVE